MKLDRQLIYSYHFGPENDNVKCLKQDSRFEEVSMFVVEVPESLLSTSLLYSIFNVETLASTFQQ